ncbi:HD domain-containing protein [Spirillospora sp. NPDC029432]|uniref:HD domain-containing protein n=1 Tax=Spirillospora sp. NPDC029432 TaxID=3154599 RepID=UPI0034524183
MSPHLRRALEEPGPRALPGPAAVLLEAVQAPPRLAAHLRAVHDVACELADWIGSRYPGAGADPLAVAFGAATHDIGKALHPEELSGPGAAHEEAGYGLLLSYGVEERLARFARTHSSWNDDGIGIDDLLVSLADKVWKAKRVRELEQLVVDRLAVASGEAPWQAFLALDDVCGRIAAGADDRISFQNAFPLAG